MSDTSRTSSRRDALKTIGGVLGGVSLLGHGTARGQAVGFMPSGYKFYRLLTANEGGNFGGTQNRLGEITGSVMMASPPSGGGIGYVLRPRNKHPLLPSSPAGVYEVAIDFGRSPPVVQRVRPIVLEGSLVQFDGGFISAGHIGTGASNALGQYVTTIEPAEPSGTIQVANSPGVYLYRPAGPGGGSWSRIIRFGDPVPDGSSLYGGDFGDVALDDDGNLLLAAARTQSPGRQNLRLFRFASSDSDLARRARGGTSLAADRRYAPLRYRSS